EKFLTFDGLQRGGKRTKTRWRVGRRGFRDTAVAWMDRGQLGVVAFTPRALQTWLTRRRQIGIHPCEHKTRFDTGIDPRNAQPPSDFIRATPAFLGIKTSEDDVAAQAAGRDVFEPVDDGHHFKLRIDALRAAGLHA